jgi:transcription antitermination factor NusG
MSSLQIDRRFAPLVLSGFAPTDASWFAIHTVARHEKRVACQLESKRIATFLPLLQQVHRWSDRRCKVEVPLFCCYAFVHVLPSAEERMQVLQTQGVLGFVGTAKQGTPIPDEEIENLQTAIREGVPVALHSFVGVGTRVRIRGGSLDGMEGILERQGEDESLVLSVELLKRSVSIQVKGYDVELV